MTVSKNTKTIKIIRSRLLDWSQKNHRSLPWKKNKDPYQIWVSEIILQQTRLEQGLPYYHRFLERYPTLEDLASSNEDDLMKIWEGLGYYRRARHMLQTARVILEQNEGTFPNTYEDILKLKGVGSYTAAAIASFAFDLPYVVVDGNVIRLISRLNGITDPVDEPRIRKKIEAIADDLLDRNDPASFNQAIMDFGSKQCKPVSPLCSDCPLSSHCVSYQEGLVSQIPTKRDKQPKRVRHFYYLVPFKGEHLYVRKRNESDIWSGLFEFYLVETKNETSWDKILSDIDLPLKKSISLPSKYKQLLSHQVIQAEFLTVELDDDRLIIARDNYIRIKRKKIRNFAFPKVIDCFLRDKDVILNL